MARTPDVGRLLRLAETARAERQPFESLWQDVADLISPSRSFSTRRSPGSRHRDDIYDSTAEWASGMLANGLYGFLTNPSIVWMKLEAVDPQINDRSVARRWLHDATETLLSFFGSEESGFATASDELYGDVVDFGIGVVRADKGDRRARNPLRFTAEPMSEFSFLAGGEDRRGGGSIDMIFRDTRMPARAVASRWPDTVSRETRRLAEKPATANDRIEILHIVYERHDRDPMRADGPNKPWASIYIEKQTKTLLSVGGFDRRRFFVARWKVASGEVYGESPSIQALPEVRMLNRVREQGLIAGDLVNRPLMAVEADSLEGPLPRDPGGVIYLQHGGKPPAPVDSGADPSWAFQQVADSVQRIERHYLLDLIRLPQLSPRGGHARMTAFEVSMRLMQQMQIMAPRIGRIEREWIGPAITEAYAMLLQSGRIPPAPAGLAGGELKITYQGPLALSQRASEATGYFQWMQAIQPLLQADPTLQQDLVDGEFAARWLGRAFNVNPRLLRTEREVARRRQTRAEQEQAADQIQAASELAGAFKDAGSGIKDTIGAQAP